MNPSSNEKYASNKNCKGLNKISMDIKKTYFGLKMKNLWPFEDDLNKLSRKEKPRKTTLKLGFASHALQSIKTIFLEKCKE